MCKVLKTFISVQKNNNSLVTMISSNVTPISATAAQLHSYSWCIKSYREGPNKLLIVFLRAKLLI